MIRTLLRTGRVILSDEGSAGAAAVCVCGGSGPALISGFDVVRAYLARVPIPPCFEA